MYSSCVEEAGRGMKAIFLPFLMLDIASGQSGLGTVNMKKESWVVLPWLVSSTSFTASMMSSCSGIETAGSE